MSWYFTSDLHLSHASILKGFRGEIFKTMEEHNETIIGNLLSLPKGSNLVIAGDLFWKFSSKQVEEFFTKFKKSGISIFIVYGNHDKMSWFKYSIIRTQGHMKDLSVSDQSITVCHYPLVVFNKSHYNAWNLHGHIHKNDATWNKMILNDPRFSGKKLNINIELHDFKPWSFDEIHEYMSTRENNWDFIDKGKKYDV